MVLASITFRQSAHQTRVVPASWHHTAEAAIDWATQMMGLLVALDGVDHDTAEPAALLVESEKSEGDPDVYAWDMVDGDWAWVRVLMPAAH